ncbi:carotenoid biosynthesis protein [Thermomicrobium sp. 4228-Ro]|uniref:carotenoid biosynthesis protein n=1 Tax=Thermomicrobium sp. 4228-Ro TaxID=2993937 RepID=UPI0022489D62|nr:carotenoid biosynthesis protein [Thermomicrobium sp. 4228-Ro]MCX2727566.1 carotenoid biosynthesis protein [Thermomicrobium sp. 4228-Ro]
MRRLSLAWLLYAAYVLALAFGVGGIAIALENPELWADLELGRAVYAFGMKWGGTAYIVLGAAALFVWAWHAIGPRKTLGFFLVTVPTSLAAELIGTSTGWPFGNYSYTSGLGWKILDRVPFTIPLSWFTVGLSSYLLAIALRSRLFPRLPSWSTVPIGVWLLVVWDLVLDPAMAHESMQARFWVWHQSGAYYGMPVINFLGWALTGFVFMSISRWIWRQEPEHFSATFPWAIYSANVLFASALCAAVGLWGPIALAALGGFLPATIALRGRIGEKGSLPRAERRAARNALAEDMAWRFLATLARRTLRDRRLKTHGLDLVPAHGPVVLAPQHIHHLDDGRILLATVPRPLRFLVALDWVPNQRWRWLMEFLCRLAGWPVIVRPSERDRPGIQYGTTEAQLLLVRGLRDAIHRVSSGQLLVVFPEGYPVIDPHLPGRRAMVGGMKPGAVWIAQQAARRLATAVPVIPVRLILEPSDTQLVFEPPIWVNADSSTDSIAKLLADRLGLHTDRAATDIREPAVGIVGKDR